MRIALGLGSRTDDNDWRPQAVLAPYPSADQRMFKLLVVDDSLAIREYCRMELQSDGYEVVVAANGTQALELCARLQPDLVVLDIRMWDLDGFEVLRRLKQDQPGLPVVLHTAHLEDCRRTVEFPADACVAKQGDLGDLRRAIAVALAGGDRN